ncbi:poly(ADP-ribose) glycohydrolase domain-containing protein [Plantactinospora sp. GCM10030261]|uniref:poly(ADP-ribose) glycohydrolase domain-containing protein n=1 Tax=Plantactinospora sp. GCM10030261 TaxID=3273420 RepID=UPI003611AD97
MPASPALSLSGVESAPSCRSRSERIAKPSRGSHSFLSPATAIAPSNRRDRQSRPVSCWNVVRILPRIAHHEYVQLVSPLPAWAWCGGSGARVGAEPGWRFLGGAEAQEEGIARLSALYPGLLAVPECP